MRSIATWHVWDSINTSISKMSNCLNIVQKSLLVPIFCISIFIAGLKLVSKDIPRRGGGGGTSKNCVSDLAKTYSERLK